MSTISVEGFLSQFSADDATFKLLSALSTAVPSSTEPIFYHSIDEARLLVAPELDDDGLERARARLNSPEYIQALKVADAIDKGDIGLSVFTGLRSAFAFFFGGRKKTLESDAQQGADAILKAAGIAWMTHRFYSGSPPEKIRKLRETPAGQSLLVWYAAADICLPFADDAAVGAGSFFSSLLSRYGTKHLNRLDFAAGAGAGEAATGMINGLTQPLEEIIQSVSGHTRGMAEKARAYLPAAIATADTISSAVATAADVLPVYRLLAARLAIEAALRQELPPQAEKPAPLPVPIPEGTV